MSKLNRKFVLLSNSPFQNDMIEELKKDLDKFLLIDGAPEEKGICKLRTISQCYGFHVLIIYRFSQWLKNLARQKIHRPWVALMYPFAIVMLRIIGRMYGIHIHPQAKIGGGFYIGHFGNIHVGKCIIAENCSIHQNCKLGDSEGEMLKIGSNVWIGAHAVITSGLTIGDNATVGAGARVQKSVNAGSMVAGNPARVVLKRYDNRLLLGDCNKEDKACLEQRGRSDA